MFLVRGASCGGEAVAIESPFRAWRFPHGGGCRAVAVDARWRASRRGLSAFRGAAVGPFQGAAFKVGGSAGERFVEAGAGRIDRNELIEPRFQKPGIRREMSGQGNDRDAFFFRMRGDTEWGLALESLFVDATFAGDDVAAAIKSFIEAGNLQKIIDAADEAGLKEAVQAAGRATGSAAARDCGNVITGLPRITCARRRRPVSSWRTSAGEAPFCGPKKAAAPRGPVSGLMTSQSTMIPVS